MSIYKTGFCWECGKICEGLFCLKPKKCAEKYQRKLDGQIKKSKREGYGLAGSTH
jgi:hypothetical protein